MLSVIFFLMIRRPPISTLCPYTTLFRSAEAVDGVRELSLLDRWTYALCPVDERDEGIARLADWAVEHALGLAVAPPRAGRLPPDRKSTRLNSSHANISYAVFCLKKKKQS